MPRVIDYKKVEALYNLEKTDKEIAEKLNCSERMVRGWRNRYKLPSALQIKLKRLYSNFELLYNAGMTDEQIAAELNLSKDMVRKFRRRKQTGENQVPKGLIIFSRECKTCGETFDAMSPRSLYCPECKKAKEMQKHNELDLENAKMRAYKRRAKASEMQIAKVEKKARKRNTTYGDVNKPTVTVTVPKFVSKQEPIDPAVRRQEYLQYLLKK